MQETDKNGIRQLSNYLWLDRIKILIPYVSQICKYLLSTVYSQDNESVYQTAAYSWEAILEEEHSLNILYILVYIKNRSLFIVNISAYAIISTFCD